MQVQILVTFHEGVSDTVIKGHVHALRRNADVAQVEFVAEPISRKPTEDGNVDTTVRGGHTFIKGPRGELLERLTDDERDVIELLNERVRQGLGPVRTQRGLLEALQAFRAENWAKRRGVSSATGPYRSAVEKLAATEWRLVDEPGIFYYQRFHEPDERP
jgi:hypothetical protein